MTGEHSPVARQSLDIVRALGERLAESLRVCEESVDLVWLDRFDHAIRVLRQVLDLGHDRLDRLAEISQILQGHIDVRCVVSQSLDEHVGILKRRMKGRRIVGEKLAGAIDNRIALR